MIHNKDDFFSIEDFVWDGYQVFGGPGGVFAVPLDAEREMVRRMIAGCKSWASRLKSIDYTLKHYGHYWESGPAKLSPSQIINLRCAAMSKEIILDIVNRRHELRNLPDVFGLFAAGAALMRLEASFNTTRFLLFHGLSFEASNCSKAHIRANCMGIRSSWKDSSRSISNGTFKID